MEERMEKRHRAEPTPPTKDSISSFLQSWAWKREHRPDRDRFQRPYLHSWTLPQSGKVGEGDPGAIKLIIEQARFHGAQGFASTVWDSSIVVAKMLERNPHLVAGRAVLDLSAGCGLIAIVAARLGAQRIIATDLGPNLPLLQRNCQRNGAAVEVMEHWWGTDTTPLLQGGGSRGWVSSGGCRGSLETVPSDLERMAATAPEDQAPVLVEGALQDQGQGREQGGGHDVKGGKGGKRMGERQSEGSAGGCSGSGDNGGLDLVIACDVMYQEEVVGPLVETLAGLCGGTYDSSSSGPMEHQQGQRQIGADHGCTAIAAATAATPNTTTTNAKSGSLTTSTSRQCSGTTVILAHGRNRFAEPAFWRHAAAAGFIVEAVPWDELDRVYRCMDVDVYRMRLEETSHVTGSEMKWERESLRRSTK